MISGLFRFSIVVRSLHNTSYAKFRRARKIAGVCAVVGVVALLLLGAGRTALAQNTPLGAPAGAVTVATDPARDAALKTYLQKHFKIPRADLLKLGPAFKSPIDGLVARLLTVTNEQGQSVATTLFIDRSGSKAVIGQYVDLSSEPWGRINLSGVSLDDRPTLGPADAPVTIVEFADFECPYCAQAFSTLETLVNTTYKGKIKVIYKSFPLNVHPWAIKAAEAAECARLQNPAAFWDFARYFYANQGTLNVDNLQEHVDQLANSLKLDEPSLKACMNSSQTEARVKQDQSDGDSIQVTSTPTFFVDGIPVVGLPDGHIMEFVINSELAKKSPHASATNE